MENLSGLFIFIRGQTLLLEKLNELDLDEQADQCEKLHEDSEALYQLFKTYPVPRFSRFGEWTRFQRGNSCAYVPIGEHFTAMFLLVEQSNEGSNGFYMSRPVALICLLLGYARTG